MTDGNPRPDAEPTPPAARRRSDDATGADDELAPPFVPGASSPPAPAPAEPAAETFPAPTPEAAPEPMPEPVPEPAEAGEEPSGEDEAFPFEEGWGGEEEAEASSDEEFPFEAFDIEGDDAEPEPGTGGTDAAAEVAHRLEAMARRLREEGVRAAEAEMGSPDRFTALLAGLLAGYLTGRE